VNQIWLWMKVSPLMSCHERLTRVQKFWLDYEKRLSNRGKYRQTGKRDESMLWLLALSIESKIKFTIPTSGEERAAFWNGTGEYNTGTSTPDKKVREDLKARTRRDIAITLCRKYGINFWTTQLNSTERYFFKKLKHCTYL
jgi:hypothetical protein